MPVPEGTTYTATGLTADTTYTFKVRAKDNNGNLSGFSNTKSVTTQGGSTPNPCNNASLAARYHFDTISGNTTADDSGNNHHATINGAVIASGKIGKGLNFDGNDDYVSIGNFNIPGNQLTLAAWIKADDFGTSDARIISKATGVQENDHIWMLSTISDGGIKPRFRLKTGSTTHTLIGTQTLNPNTWYHIAATYDGSKMRLYINGVEKGSLTKTGNIASSSAGIRIGDNPIQVKHFDGIIDEVNLYRTALTPAEITTLKYGDGLSASCPAELTVQGECDGVAGIDINEVLTPSTPPKGECDGVEGMDINDVVCTINKVLAP